MATDKISPFFTYMGNKFDLAEWIVPLLAPHEVYVEVFGGTYALGLNKPKSKVEIYNDLNKHMSNLFYCVIHNCDEFIKRIDYMIISEHWYNDFHKQLEVNYSRPLEELSMEERMDRAVMYFYIMCLTFRGKFTGGFSYKAERSFGEILQNKQSIVRAIYERVKNVIILNKNCFDVIRQNNNEKTLLYLDPPYVSTESYYKKLAGEFGIEEHYMLRDELTKHKGFFFLSYEDDELVSDLYHNFTIHRKELGRATNKETKNEVLVTNYKPVTTLFSFAN